MQKTTRRPWLIVCVLFNCLPCLSTAQPASLTVQTYAYDTGRTGWNSSETVLNASSFPKNFGVLATVSVDDQVDAQPLLVPGERIAGQTHDVLYVVTESNSVYALDANTGSVLLHRNLGPAVATPLGCGNNGPNVGITSTPVIDVARNRLYVMAYLQGVGPYYRLHALNLQTLADAVPAVTVVARHALTNGREFAFDAIYQRQRPALLELDGSIYAGFGSFCDFSATHSRGWVLGWSASHLQAVPGSQLNDTQASSATDFFLSSVWMSGSGLASDGSSIFFSTGNSDCNFYVSPEDCPAQSTYNGVTNIQESVIALQPSLQTVRGVFTPSNVFQMDIDDADLGAAGIMLLPTAAGDGENLATIVSKDGRLWLLDRSNLGTYQGVYQLANGCWCKTSFFYGSDNIPRVVTSAQQLQTWQVVSSPTPHLVLESTTSTIPADVQDPGFFTTISSNNRVSGSAIIWAVGRPTSTTGLILYAFAANPISGTLPLLYSAAAGSWPNLGGNANIVPLVANGKVYVGAYQTVTIFGPGGAAPASSANLAASAQLSPGLHQTTGILSAVDGAHVTLVTRSGQSVVVDTALSLGLQHGAALVIGQAYTAIGPSPQVATSVTRAKPGQGAWPADQ
jgi:hypothetical protein